MFNGPRAWAGELLGTFGFITIGAGSVVVATSGVADLGTLGVATAHGLGLAIMVTVFMSLTGGQLNPAVTLSVWASGRMRGIDAIGYVVAQVAGALAAAAVIRTVFHEAQWGISNVGTPALAGGVGGLRAALMEAVFTFFLLTVVWGTGIDERGRMVGGFAIGLTVFASILVVGDQTGAALNPARYLGPAIASGDLGDWWIYLVGPGIGGIAALLYPLLFLPGGIKWLRVGGVMLPEAQPTAPARTPRPGRGARGSSRRP